MQTIIDWCTEAKINGRQHRLFVGVGPICTKIFLAWNSVRLKATRHQRDPLKQLIDTYCERNSATEHVDQAQINSQLITVADGYCSVKSDFSRKIHFNDDSFTQHTELHKLCVLRSEKGD